MSLAATRDSKWLLVAAGATTLLVSCLNLLPSVEHFLKKSMSTESVCVYIN
jgi:hypothetical protein